MENEQKLEIGGITFQLKKGKNMVVLSAGRGSAPPYFLLSIDIKDGLCIYGSIGEELGLPLGKKGELKMHVMG